MLSGGRIPSVVDRSIVADASGEATLDSEALADPDAPALASTLGEDHAVGDAEGVAAWHPANTMPPRTASIFNLVIGAAYARGNKPPPG